MAGDHLAFVKRTHSAAVEAVLIEEDLRVGVHFPSCRHSSLHWEECLDCLWSFYLVGYHPYLCVVSRAPMGEDVRGFVCTSGGQILPGKAIQGTLPDSWSDEYVTPYGVDISLGAPFIESGVEPEVEG